MVDDVETVSPIRQAVEVVAPLDMPAGYQFRVNVNGRVLEAQVPDTAGVSAGQRFAAWILNDNGDYDDNVNLPQHTTTNPSLTWRDGFFQCFRLGIFHPMFCLALWCAPCALGQVMTRVNLDIAGNPRTSNERMFWTPYKFLFAITTGYIVLRGVTETIIDAKVDDDRNDDDVFRNSTDASDDDDDDSYPAWAEAIIFFRFLVFLSFAIFTFVLITKTRQYIRRKDNIPAETCGKMEDCCVSVWCPWCTICHMARHTANYDQQGARCCTDTGLTENAPLYA